MIKKKLNIQIKYHLRLVLDIMFYFISFHLFNILFRIESQMNNFKKEKNLFFMYIEQWVEKKHKPTTTRNKDKMSCNLAKKKIPRATTSAEHIAQKEEVN